jgi:hypothetical protein
VLDSSVRAKAGGRCNISIFLKRRTMDLCKRIRSIQLWLHAPEYSDIPSKIGKEPRSDATWKDPGRDHVSSRLSS